MIARREFLDSACAGAVFTGSAFDAPWENGYFTIQDKPGYGIELAPGESWWG